MTQALQFRKIESGDETRYSTFYLFSKAEAIINKIDMDCVFDSIYSIITSSNIQNLVGKSSGWTIDSVVDDTIIMLKHKPLRGSSYIKLPKRHTIQ